MALSQDLTPLLGVSGASGASWSWSYVNGSAAGADGGTSVTANCSGANVGVIMMATNGTPASATVSDSTGATWNASTTYSENNVHVEMLWAKLTSPGASEQFTVTLSGYALGMAAACFSGDPSVSLDAQNGNTGTGTSLSTGSVTPSANDLVITALGNSETTSGPTINSGFSAPLFIGYESGENWAAGLSYTVTSSAQDPTWSGLPGANSAAVILALK
jgi:hypothetical protein